MKEFTMPFKTTFKDAVVKDVPRKGSGTYGSEPGLPGRDGGLLPEKIREDVKVKNPSFKELDGKMRWDKR
jgi:hypothetical protein